MKLIMCDLSNNIVDTIKCTLPISKCIEECKKKYPPGKYTGFLTC
jgi:hypothetical protein